MCFFYFSIRFGAICFGRPPESWICIPIPPSYARYLWAHSAWGQERVTILYTTLLSDFQTPEFQHILIIQMKTNVHWNPFKYCWKFSIFALFLPNFRTFEIPKPAPFMSIVRRPKGPSINDVRKISHFLPPPPRPQNLAFYLYTRYPIVACALGKAAECAREQRYLAYKPITGKINTGARICHPTLSCGRPLWMTPK